MKAPRLSNSDIETATCSSSEFPERKYRASSVVPRPGNLRHRASSRSSTTQQILSLSCRDCQDCMHTIDQR